MMKRSFLFLMLIVFSICSIFAVNGTMEAVIDTEFSAKTGVIAGFSTQWLDSTIAPSSDTPFEASFDKVDATYENYTTGIFYLYVIAFTSGPIEVSITSSEPLKNESGATLAYTNSGTTSSSFSGSGSTGEIFSEEGEFNSPRTTNLGFNLNIPISEVENASGTYTGTITVTVSYNS